MSKFDGMIAVVTGAASGIGRATALKFASEGATVVVADYVLEGAQRVREEIISSGGKAIAIFVDAGSEASIKEMIQTTVDSFGKIDILHNNVGGSNLSKDLDVVKIDVEEWDRVINLNLKSVLLGCKYVIPVMVANGGGSIVNTTSCAGFAGDLIRTAYGAAKAGVINLTKYVATQYGRKNIRCNSVAPGLVLTPAALNNLPQQTRDMFLKHNLLNRPGIPEDIANLVTFLASEDAAFITGQTITADGGAFSVHNPTYADMLPI